MHTRHLNEYSLSVACTYSEATVRVLKCIRELHSYRFESIVSKFTITLIHIRFIVVFPFSDEFTIHFVLFSSFSISRGWTVHCESINQSSHFMYFITWMYCTYNVYESSSLCRHLDYIFRLFCLSAYHVSCSCRMISFIFRFHREID